MEMRRSGRRDIRQKLGHVYKDERVVRDTRERDQIQGRGRGVKV